MIAQELEVSLHMAFVEARQKQHEFITVEHLLLAMLDNPSAAEVLKACGVDLDELRGVLTDFISEHTPRLSPHSDADTQPTQGFQRVIQRAILHVQSSGKKEVEQPPHHVEIVDHRVVENAVRHRRHVVGRRDLRVAAAQHQHPLQCTMEET